jgi:hypothetical protein
MAKRIQSGTIIDNCTLSDCILNALLLHVTPGKDEETLDEINELLGKDVNVYVGFGRHDLIVIDERSDFSLLERYHQSGLRSVKEWSPVVGLKWKAKHKKSEKYSKETKLIGFSLIKLNPGAFKKTGKSSVEVEIDLVTTIRSKLRCHIYSGLGLNELIVVIETQTFAELTRKLLTIKKELLYSSAALVLDICTVPAINYRLWTKNKNLFNDTEEIDVYLLLSLGIGLSKDFDLTLKKVCDKIKSTYGFHDVLLELNGTANQVIKTLSDIRNKGASSGLYSTFAMLTHPDNIIDSKASTISASKEIRTKPKETRDYEIYARGKRNQLSFYKRSYEVLREDPATKYLFRDNDFFASVEELLRTEEKSKSEALRPTYKELRLDILQESLRVGFDQRCAGIHPGNLLCERTARMEPLGGIQRVLLAMESIPLFLLHALKFGSWRGFCIYGYSSRFYTAQCGIINVPEIYRTRPEFWFSVFHETGHEAFNYLDEDREMNIKIMREINKILTTIDVTEESEKENAKVQILNFTEEIFAELFGFHYGFRDDWDLYVKRYWSYFATEYQIDTEHLARSVLAYFTFGPGKDLMKDQITLPVFEACLRDIEKTVEKATNTPLYASQTSDLIPIFWLYIDMADLFRCYLAERPLVFSHIDVKDLNKCFHRGHIVKHDNPIDLMYAFLSDSAKHSCRHRFALILSLYRICMDMSIENANARN